MTTLKKKVEFIGLGIHSGMPVKMLVKPSKENGIIFYRVDVNKKVPIRAIYNNVSETKMNNSLKLKTNYKRYFIKFKNFKLVLKKENKWEFIYS